MTLRSVILTALAATVVSTPALANSSETVRSIVEIGDLDLSQQRDRDAMNARVEAAARKICKSGPIGAQERAFEADCVKSMLAQSEPQIERAIALANKPGAMKLTLNIQK